MQGGKNAHQQTIVFQNVRIEPHHAFGRKEKILSLRAAGFIHSCNESTELRNYHAVMRQQ